MYSIKALSFHWCFH